MKNDGLKNSLHHTAIYVADILWYIDFFDKALDMKVSRMEDRPEGPKQVWLHGGIQLIEKRLTSDVGTGILAHLGLICRDQTDAVRRVASYALETCPQGENWLKLPGGVVLELMQEG